MWDCILPQHSAVLSTGVKVPRETVNRRNAVCADMASDAAVLMH